MKIVVIVNEDDEVTVLKPEDLKDPHALYSIRDTGLRHVVDKKFDKTVCFIPDEEIVKILGFKPK